MPGKKNYLARFQTLLRHCPSPIVLYSSPASRSMNKYITFTHNRPDLNIDTLILQTINNNFSPWTLNNTTQPFSGHWQFKQQLLLYGTWRLQLCVPLIAMATRGDNKTWSGYGNVRNLYPNYRQRRRIFWLWTRKIVNNIAWIKLFNRAPNWQQ